ncbi:hypothetical protein NFI96_003083 [Prochilodus magdalenae]|nr:hypothetical protein NFI96_003083 [Prochilodus magdalenae]
MTYQAAHPNVSHRKKVPHQNMVLLDVLGTAVHYHKPCFIGSIMKGMVLYHTISGFNGSLYGDTGALQIENTEETDQGKYECVASNVEGVRYSSPANLYVRVRRVPPRFSILPASHEIMPGGSVNITCVAVGSPMPYVKWMLNSEDLTPEDDMPVGRNVLELNSVRESANYTCVAMSSLGIIEAVSQIIVKSLPKPPGTPIVTETTATSITITWDSGNPEPVLHYNIQYRAKTPDSKFETMESIATTRYSIGGLSPNTEYEIRVSAVNTIGQGPASEPVEARTGEQAPASPPRNIQARIISHSTMMVRWEEPEEPNGQIKGYRVYYTMDPSQPMSSWQIHNVQDSMITTIQNLVTSETYTIRVLAFTSVGDGPFSDPIHVKVLQGVPGQPSKFQIGEVSDTTIELTWEPAFEKEGIISYELRYKEASQGSLDPHRTTTEQCWSYSSPSSVGTGRCPTGRCPTGRCPTGLCPTGRCPTGLCPQDAAPEDAAHRTLPTGRCPQDSAHRTLPTGLCPQDAAPQDAAPQDAAPQDAAHRTLPHRTLPTGRCPQDAASQDAASQDAAHRTLLA